MAAKEIIKKIRLSLCLTQAELAKKLGVTTPSVCNWEAGRRTPQLSIIRDIRAFSKAQGLKVPAVEDFLE